GSVTLGSTFNPSTPTITVDSAGGSATNLLISGVIQNPTGGGGLGFTKDGTGRLILTHANTFTSQAFIARGAINMEDSQALGLASQAPNPNQVTVASGAALEL